VKQIPVPWAEGPLRQDILQRVLELTYTAYDIEPFAEYLWNDVLIKRNGLSNSPGPFKWDEERRFLIRCELDAIYFHLYGIGRDDAVYVMETFPIVKRKDEHKYGEYRTKRVMLECYDAMAEAMKISRPYQMILNPPSADRRIAHQPLNSEVQVGEEADKIG
jgi:hypothetical protein